MKHQKVLMVSSTFSFSGCILFRISFISSYIRSVFILLLSFTQESSQTIPHFFEFDDIDDQIKGQRKEIESNKSA